MSFDIGDAKIQLTVDLENLRKQLLDATKEIDKFVESAGEEINIDISSDKLSGITNSFQLIGDSMNEVKDNFTDLAGESEQSFGIVNSVLNETANTAFGTGSVMSAVSKDVIASVGAVGVSMGTLAAATGGAVVILAVLAAEVYALMKFLGDVIDRTKEYISQNSDLQNAIESVKNAVSDLTDGFVKIYEALRDRLAGALYDIVVGLVNTWNEMNKTTGAGDNLLAALGRLMSSGFELVMRVVDAVVKVFSSFSGASDDSSSKVDQLTSHVQALTTILNGVAFVFEKVALGIQMVGSAAASVAGLLQPVIEKVREILSGLYKIANSGLGALFGMSLPEGPDMPFPFGEIKSTSPDYYDYGEEGAGPGNREGKNTRALYLNNQKSGSTGTQTKEKEIDLEKEEKKILDELIEGYESKLRLIEASIPLGEATVYNLQQELQNYRDALDVKMQSLNYDSNIYDTQLKLKNVRNDILSISKQYEESQKEILELAGKEAQNIKGEILERIGIEKKAEDELTKLELKNAGDISRLKLFEIDKVYDEEEKRIRNTYKETDKVQKLITELKKAKQKEIENVTIQGNRIIFSMLEIGYNTVMNFIITGFNEVWEQVFGKANSLLEQLIQNIYNRMVELVTSSIFESLIKLLSGGGVTGIFGWIGGLFGTDGFTGTGSDDEPAGIVHRNEFVVNPKGALIPENRIFLELMNQGKNVADLFNEKFGDSFNLFRLNLPDLSGINSGSGIRKGDNNINLGGIKTIVNNQSLSGLDDGQWNKIVDEDIIPQVSRGLKRIGKQYLDNKINI